MVLCICKLIHYVFKHRTTSLSVRYLVKYYYTASVWILFDKHTKNTLYLDINFIQSHLVVLLTVKNFIKYLCYNVTQTCIRHFFLPKIIIISIPQFPEITYKSI